MYATPCRSCSESQFCFQSPAAQIDALGNLRASDPQMECGVHLQDLPSSDGQKGFEFLLKILSGCS